MNHKNDLAVGPGAYIYHFVPPHLLHTVCGLLQTV